MPPAAFVFLPSSFPPLLKLVPGVAPLPESSMMPANFTGEVSAAVAMFVAPMSAAKMKAVFLKVLFIVLSPSGCNLTSRRPECIGHRSNRKQIADHAEPADHTG